MSESQPLTDGAYPATPLTSSLQTTPKPNRTRQLFISLIAILLILTVAVGASGLIVSLREGPKRAEPVIRGRTVQAYQTRQMDIQELITGFGTVRPMQQVVLSAEVAGVIVETIEPLKVGQPVKATNVTILENGTSQRDSGDVIVQIDSQTYQERLDQAEDRLKEDQADLTRLSQEQKNLERRLKIQEESFAEFEKEYLRVKSLVSRGVVSESQLTTAELDLRRYEDAKVQLDTELQLMPAKIEQAQARLTTHRNDVAIARLDFERTAVTTPVSGQLSEIHVEKGQYVRVGDALVTVTNLQQVEIPVGIPMQDYLKLIPQITQGLTPKAELRTSSQNETVWRGDVVRAAPVADPATRTVEVFIVVDNRTATTPLLPGTFVTVSIDGPVYDNVVPLPRDAVYQKKIFVVENETAIERQIDVIATLESILLTRESLQPGEQVIMTNLDILEQGDKVKISDEGLKSLTEELIRLRLPTLRLLKEYEREQN